MKYDSDMTERERWAEDHGYWHGICPKHGDFWTDGSGCENCPDDKEDYEELGEGQFRCANCGDIFDEGEKVMSEEFAYCPTCWLEFQ